MLLNRINRRSLRAVEVIGRAIGPVWWGEAPVRLYDLNEAPSKAQPSVWLHQNARRAAVYQVPRLSRSADACDHF